LVLTTIFPFFIFNLLILRFGNFQLVTCMHALRLFSFGCSCICMVRLIKYYSICSTYFYPKILIYFNVFAERWRHTTWHMLFAK
jgi:hypothetical protein